MGAAQGSPLEGQQAGREAPGATTGEQHDAQQQRPRLPLASGHAFESFDWQMVEVDDADWAMEMKVTPLVVNSSGVLQGGLIATLVDMVAGTALLRGERPYAQCTTTELHMNFLNPARTGPVLAVAKVLRRGRQSAVVRVDVRDRATDDRLVAAATLTFAVRGTGPGGAEGTGRPE